jgi:magnesium transporter
MYLSDRAKGIEHPPEDHEDLEVLLESYSKQVEEIVNEANSMEVLSLFHY